jgi:hypothetical protein
MIVPGQRQRNFPTPGQQRKCHHRHHAVAPRQQSKQPVHRAARDRDIKSNPNRCRRPQRQQRASRLGINAGDQVAVRKKRKRRRKSAARTRQPGAEFERARLQPKLSMRPNPRMARLQPRRHAQNRKTPGGNQPRCKTGGDRHRLRPGISRIDHRNHIRLGLHRNSVVVANRPCKRFPARTNQEVRSALRDLYQTLLRNRQVARWSACICFGTA